MKKIKKIFIATGVSSTLLLSSLSTTSPIAVNAQVFSVEGQATYYDTGNQPAIAVNESGRIFEIHQSGEGNNHIYYNLGKLKDKNITWDKGKDSGTQLVDSNGSSIEGVYAKNPEIFWLDDETILLTVNNVKDNTINSHLLKIINGAVTVVSSKNINIPYTKGPFSSVTHNSTMRTLSIDQNGNAVMFFQNKNDRHINFVVGQPQFDTSGTIVGIKWGDPIDTNNQLPENSRIASVVLGKDGTIVAANTILKKLFDGGYNADGRAYRSLGKMDKEYNVTWDEKNIQYDNDAYNIVLSISGDKVIESYTTLGDHRDLKSRLWKIRNVSLDSRTIEQQDDQGFYNNGKEQSLTLTDGYLIESHVDPAVLGRDDLYYSISEAEENINLTDFNQSGVTVTKKSDETVYGSPVYKLTANRADEIDYLNYTINGSFYTSQQEFSIWLRADKEQTATLRLRSEMKGWPFEPNFRTLNVKLTEEWKEYKITHGYQMRVEFIQAEIYPAGSRNGTGTIYAANPQIGEKGEMYQSYLEKLVELSENLRIDGNTLIVPFGVAWPSTDNDKYKVVMRIGKYDLNEGWITKDYDYDNQQLIDRGEVQLGMWREQAEWNTLYRAMALVLDTETGNVLYHSYNGYYMMPEQP
ncbi:hypothetical protein WAK64_10905 [Bacillus spongiae]|uniref:CBM-cenC domain-containing protein n=1 Tax=Bacillus spongiae TaxID=2683610 RepID=A0ABU8HEK1_9BACI